jgi:hypothetical protein
MNPRTTILYYFSLIILAGCATQYQKAGFSGGFVEKQASRNEFYVNFAGNGYTTGQRAVDLCILRCAEITLAHGFFYFVLADSKTEFDRSTAITTGSFIPTGFGDGLVISTTQVIPKPMASNRILCFRGQPRFFSKAYDARKTFDDLAVKYRLRRPVESLHPFGLFPASLGMDIALVQPPRQPMTHQNEHVSMLPAEPAFKVRGFARGSDGPKSGIKIGDVVIAVDGVPISETAKLNDRATTWQVGQRVEVTLNGPKGPSVIAVTAIFEDKLIFRKQSELICNGIEKPEDVMILEGAATPILGYTVATFEDWENPVESLKQFENYAAMAAFYKGANAIQILRSGEEIKDSGFAAEKQAGFACLLKVCPKARVGVEYETGVGYEKRRIIRRIHDDAAQSAGLKIGDNVLAINGTDLVQQESQAAKESMKWAIGDTVEVTVARDGKEIKLPVKTVSNRI